MMLLPLSLVLVSFFSPVWSLNQWDNYTPLTILYSGTTSLNFTWAANGSAICPGTVAEPSASLFVGVDPPWDDNPFFFEIYQNGYPAAVNMLDIFTAAYICYNGDNVCADFEWESFYFVPEEKLNLSQATVNRASIAGEPGYTVTGDNKTYVGNSDNTSDPAPWAFTYTLPDDCGSYPDCNTNEECTWGPGEPFQYNITFSNSSALATLSLNTGLGMLILQFSGTREEQNTSFQTGIALNGSIQLNTSNASEPTFTFTNGSKIVFHHDSYYYWDTAGSWGSSLATRRTTNWMVLFGITGLTLLLILL